MASPRRIGPLPPPSTPPELRLSRWSRSTLAPDLLRQASQRLGIMSLTAAALWALGPLLGHLAFRTPFGMQVDGIATASIAVSLALFAYTRRSRRDPAFILDLGLAYMVLMAFAIGLMNHVSLMLLAEAGTTTV